jgi:hypothetical protein
MICKPSNSGSQTTISCACRHITIEMGDRVFEPHRRTKPVIVTCRATQSTSTMCALKPLLTGYIRQQRLSSQRHQLVIPQWWYAGIASTNAVQCNVTLRSISRQSKKK